MKDNKTSELKPVYIHETSTQSYDDEISLVDLALVLIRRKYLIGFIFLLCLSIGIASSLLISSKATDTNIYTYTISIQIGSLINSQGIQLLESPETLQVKIEKTFIPQLFNELKSQYPISVNIPKNSQIILLEATSPQEQDKDLIRFLTSLTQKIELDHEQMVMDIKLSLETYLKPVNIEEYALQIAGLQKTYAISPPIQTVTPTKTNAKLIIIISAFFGLFAGIFMAFFAEFISKVKAEITYRESTKEN